MRKPIIAGNWKMNNTPSQAVELIEAIKPLVKDAKCDVVVCPTFVCLDAASKALKGSNVYPSEPEGDCIPTVQRIFAEIFGK